MSDTLTNAEVEAWLSDYEKRRTGYFGVSVQENEAAKFARTILEERKAFKVLDTDLRERFGWVDAEAAERIRRWEEKC